MRIFHKSRYFLNYFLLEKSHQKITANMNAVLPLSHFSQRSETRCGGVVSESLSRRKHRLKQGDGSNEADRVCVMQHNYARTLLRGLGKQRLSATQRVQWYLSLTDAELWKSESLDLYIFLKLEVWNLFLSLVVISLLQMHFLLLCCVSLSQGNHMLCGLQADFLLSWNHYQLLPECHSLH